TMLQMVQRRALREAQHLLELERSYGQLEARLVHSAITNVRVDGYPVTNPVGFTGKNLEVTVFNTFAPMTHIDAIETVVRELDLELAAAVAQPYALARACANEEIWAEGGIFVDVGGGTTDVALIRDGGVEGTRMFNLGGRAFTRRLALAFGLSYEEAEARKLRHSEGLLSSDQHRQVSELLGADAEVLLQGLALSIKELSRGERLPSSIYLCGGRSLLPELTLEMVKNNWAAGLPFPREPRVRHLVPPDVRNLTDSTGQLTSPQDIAPMGLANHALRTEAEERDTVNTVMRRVLSAIKVCIDLQETTKRHGNEPDLRRNRRGDSRARRASSPLPRRGHDARPADAIAHRPEPVQLPAASQLLGPFGQARDRGVRRPGRAEDGLRERLPCFRCGQPRWRRHPVRSRDGAADPEVVAARAHRTDDACRHWRPDQAAHQDRD